MNFTLHRRASATHTPAALAAALGLVLALPAAAGPLFTAPFLTAGTGHIPVSVAIGDLDRDGKPDLVVANSSETDNTFSVLLGRLDGTFAPHADYGAGLRPHVVVVTDMNRDSRPDVLVASDQLLRELIGDGHGGFTAEVDRSIGGAPTSIAVGDLNGDGKKDIAIANSGSNSVSVLFDDGHGDLPTGTSVACDTIPLAVAIGDVTGDGKPDLVLACEGSPPNSSGSICVIRGNGNGTFGARTDIPFGQAPSALVLADVNGDGKLDVIVTDRTANTVSVLAGNGDGTFAAPVSWATGNCPSALALADLDADGLPDLVVVNTCDNSLTLLRGLGGGAFGARTDIATGVGPTGVAVGDLNGDGRPDLAVADCSNDNVSVLLANRDGTFGVDASYADGFHPVDLLATDVNADGLPDVVTCTGNWIIHGEVAVRLGGPGGTLGPRLVRAIAGVPTALAAADLDGDGVTDLAVTSSSGVSVLSGLGGGTYAASSNYAVRVNAAAVATGDLDGDGHVDLVVASASNARVPGALSILVNQGNGTFGPPVELTGEFSPVGVVVADLDGDGRLDLADADAVYAQVCVRLGHGDGTFGPRADHQLTGAPFGIVAADVNGDGKLDLVTADQDGTYARSVSVLLGTGGGNFAAPVSYALPGTNYDFTYLSRRYGPSLAVADVNGDGKPDIVVPDLAASTVSVLPGLGDGTFGDRTDFGAGPLANSVAIADMNRDGRPDLVVASDADSGRVRLLFNTGGLAWAGVPPAAGPAGAVRLAAWPNPPAGQVTLAWALPAAAAASLGVYDVAGRLVATLAHGRYGAGTHELRWDLRAADGRRVRPGVYLVELRAGAWRATQRLAVMR